MGEQRNTIVCVFDLKSPRISACDIHEWIYAQMRPDENEINMVQIDETKIHYVSRQQPTARRAQFDWRTSRISAYQWRNIDCVTRNNGVGNEESTNYKPPPRNAGC
jgi:hypothetical protein